ncbi:helix-turn-helix transcriptional regulator [Actinoallomurus iriomotensis]|uniref:Helix-turn-helix transcriptional regulator n=1 Tax=Actinoallomurus iriomotensis TaxID=478107 RepID=A0A9W6W7Y4_9ACTN|nr:LuxR family transcriptional regulator [Actinoallomurus iriomotensis]GLY92646.1 helix-turn-helix transcriptional regulator [Actinoallomurus iriomotensis]
MRLLKYPRAAELAAVERTLRAAAAGQGGTILVRGEAGIGKTELIERALDRTAGLRPLRAVGREFETELPFIGLHELCQPLLPYLETLPGPQRTALEVAFAMREGAMPDLFRVGLAVLGLLSAAASEQPIVCVVDDAQWLDHASTQALAFVARRIEHDPIALLFAVRGPGAPDLLDGLPELTLTGLGNEDALALLASRMHTPLDERIRDQIIAEARGNPLALLELLQNVGTAELAGGFGLPNALPVPARIEAAYRERLSALPESTQWLLLLAAAEPLGDPVLLWRAAEQLGIGIEAADPAEAAGLIDMGVRVRFRHPLVRSAIYRAASPDDRRTVHRALADVIDPLVDPDHRAWHRAQSVLLPDEDIAAELERAADRASARGGLAAAAGFLERATALTPDPGSRALRALNAARLKYWAGANEAATGLLAIARTGPGDERHQALVELLAVRISITSGPRLKDPAPLLDAARKLETYDRPMARQTYVEAFVTAMRAGRLGPPGLLTDTAHQLEEALEEGSSESSEPPDLLLKALIMRTIDGTMAAIPSLRRAVGAFLSETEQTDRFHHWVALAGATAMDLWEHDAWRTLSERQVLLIRRTGVLAALPSALHYLAYAHVLAGGFQDAEALIAEATTIDPTGNPSGPPFGDLALRAWRGDQEGTAALVERMIGPARESGEGHSLSVIDGANAVLCNGLGRYDAAFEAAAEVCRYDELGFAAFISPELIEAAARSGRHRLAKPVLENLTERTDASGTDLALGLQMYARALLADGPGAEDLYRKAIDRLARTRAAAYLARAHLVYGEWLRRAGRRGDARAQLRIAYEMLAGMGAAGFAERAARELSACGQRPYRPAAPPRDLLTPQELQIARLVAGGATSKEAAEQLFVSPRTVHAHLRNIFKKLGITSRLQLRDLQLDSPGDPRPDPVSGEGPEGSGDLREPDADATESRRYCR